MPRLELEIEHISRQMWASCFFHATRGFHIANYKQLHKSLETQDDNNSGGYLSGITGIMSHSRSLVMLYCWSAV